MKVKFFRGILRQLSVLLKNNFKKKKGQRSEVIKKFDVFFYKIHEIQTQIALEDFMLEDPNAQRIPLKKTFCSKMLKINLRDDFEQKVFLSAMHCALGFPNIKSSFGNNSFFRCWFYNKEKTKSWEC